MKKTFIIYSIILTFHFSWGNAGSLIGKWRYVAKYTNVKLSLSLNIQEDKSHFKLECNVSGKVGEVSAEIPTVISKYNYQILKDIDKNTMVNDFQCRLKIPADVMTYDLNDNQLKLTTSDGNPTFFTLEE